MSKYKDKIYSEGRVLTNVYRQAERRNFHEFNEMVREEMSIRHQQNLEYERESLKMTLDVVREFLNDLEKDKMIKIVRHTDQDESFDDDEEDEIYININL